MAYLLQMQIHKASNLTILRLEYKTCSLNPVKIILYCQTKCIQIQNSRILNTSKIFETLIVESVDADRNKFFSKGENATLETGPKCF